jgi:hypothetical protein
MKYVKPLLKTILLTGALTTSGTLLADIAYPNCYFNNNGSVSSYWGLNPNNSWYSFSGTNFTTPYSNMQKFSTSTPYSDLVAACQQAKIYYNLPNASTLFAIFAKYQSLDNNRPIVVGGGELFPQY